MSNKIKKYLSLTLVMIMLLSVFVACNGDDVGGTTTTTPGGNVQDTTPNADVTTTVGEEKEEAPAVFDTDGYEFIILCKDNELWFEMYANEAGAQTGEAISDALYTREVHVEDLYNCEIELVIDSNAHEKIKLNDAAGSGEHICDLLYVTGTKTLEVAMAGALRNVLEIDELKLDASYWDQNIQKEYQIGTALYCLEGDINIRDDLRTMQITVNKELYNEYKLNDTYGDIYDLVRNYQWTFDTMLEMIKDRHEDPDGNDQSMADTYGLIAEATAPYYFMLGSGLRAVENNNNKLESCLTDSTLLDAVDKTMTLASKKEVAIINGGKIIGTNSVWDDAIELFVNDKAIFRSSALSSVNGYIDMESEYAIVPVPMLYSTGTRYYCWVAAGNHYPASIPYEGIEDIKTTATIIEALAYYSKYLETDNYNMAFYEKLADYRLGRTKEDVEMLDLIFDSKTFELDQPLAATMLENRMYAKTKEQYTDSFASIIKGLESTARYNVIRIQETFDKVAAAEG